MSGDGLRLALPRALVSSRKDPAEETQPGPLAPTLLGAPARDHAQTLPHQPDHRGTEIGHHEPADKRLMTAPPRAVRPWGIQRAHRASDRPGRPRQADPHRSRTGPCHRPKSSANRRSPADQHPPGTPRGRVELSGRPARPGPVLHESVPRPLSSAGSPRSQSSDTPMRPSSPCRVVRAGRSRARPGRLAALPCTPGLRGSHSVTVSAWRWATFQSPPSRRYTWVARRVYVRG